MNTELWIDGQLCDLEKKEVVAMSYGVNRLTEIKSRQGYYSNTFNLPRTENNLNIFGIPTELNSTDTTRWERLECQIITNGVQEVYGFAKLQGVKDNIKVVVKGGNAEWIDELNGRYLADIDLSDLDHIPDGATVHANRFNDYTDGFVYPDVDYGLLQYMQSEINPNFLFPAVFVRTLIERMFSELNWTLVNELDSISKYNKLVIPFSNDTVLHSDSWSEGVTFNAHIETHTISEFDGLTSWWAGLDNDSTGGYFDYGNQITLGAWSDTVNLAGYQPSEQYEQLITAEITFTVTYWNNPSSALSFSFPNVGVLADYVSYVHAGGTGSFTATIQARTITELDQAINVKSTFVGVQITGGRIYNEVLSNTYYRGSEWNFSVNMPVDFLQTDLLRYVVNAFSALIIPDNLTRTIRIVRFDDVPSNDTEDWSDKIDLEERPEITNDYGDYKLDNFLEYSNDTGDKWLKDYKNLGRHSIQNTYIDSGTKTLYKSPLSLVNRSLTMDRSMEKAVIDLHGGKIGFSDLFIVNLTINAIGNNGIVIVSGGAEQLEAGDTIFLENINGSQLWNGISIEEYPFVISEVVNEYTIDLGKDFTGTTATSGRVRTNVIKNWISVDDVSEIEKGYEVSFTGLDGSQTVGGTDVNGAISEVVEVRGKRSIRTNSQVATTTFPTEGRVVFFEDFFDLKGTATRIAVHEVVENSTALIQLRGQPKVTDASELYHAPLHWSELVDENWTLLESLIVSPQMVKMLMRLSSIDINQLDFTKPKWIGYFGCYFYLSYVDQYKTNRVESTEVELVRLP